MTHTSKVKLKILQARLQQYVNHEIPDVQAGFRKGRGTRDQIANTHWIIKKQGSSRKICTSALLTMPNPWQCGPQQTLENSERDGNQTTWSTSWEIRMQVRKQQLALDREQQTGSK